MSEETKRFYSKKQFAEMLGVSIPTINRRIADGSLKVVKFGCRVLIPSMVLDELMGTVSPFFDSREA